MAVKKKSTNTKSATTTKNIKLIHCDEKHPVIRLKPGMKFEVSTVPVVGIDLNKPAKIAARLCGGTSTCLALIEIE